MTSSAACRWSLLVGNNHAATWRFCRVPPSAASSSHENVLTFRHKQRYRERHLTVEGADRIHEVLSNRLGVQGQQQ